MKKDRSAIVSYTNHYGKQIIGVKEKADNSRDKNFFKEGEIVRGGKGRAFIDPTSGSRFPARKQHIY